MRINVRYTDNYCYGKHFDTLIIKKENKWD